MFFMPLIFSDIFSRARPTAFTPPSHQLFLKKDEKWRRKPVTCQDIELTFTKAELKRPLYAKHNPPIVTMASKTCPPPSSVLSQSEQEKLIMKLDIFKIQGTDKRGHPILRIIGKLFPASLVSVDALKKFLEDEIFPNLSGKQFSIVYVNSGVNRSENFPGILALKWIYEAIPIQVRQNVEAVYFLHPTLQSRFFLATIGRLLFAAGGGLYWKLKYVNRLEFLWDNVRWNELEMPEFVYDFDEEMEYRPTMDFGLESDHPRLIHGDWTIATYSMRSIA